MVRETLSIAFDVDTAKARCGLGLGPPCCAFLSYGAGWRCLKGTNNERVIRDRLASGTMTAKGDRCGGPPDFAARAAEPDPALV